jgi:hypothetical protein
VLHRTLRFRHCGALGGGGGQCSPTNSDKGGGHGGGSISDCTRRTTGSASGEAGSWKMPSRGRLEAERAIWLHGSIALDKER